MCVAVFFDAARAVKSTKADRHPSVTRCALENNSIAQNGLSNEAQQQQGQLSSSYPSSLPQCQTLGCYKSSHRRITTKKTPMQ